MRSDGAVIAVIILAGARGTGLRARVDTTALARVDPGAVTIP